MQIRDVRFIQVFNLIKRYEQLLISAAQEGLDVTMANELLNEAKYALKLKKYEVSVDYVKRVGNEIVRIKKEKEEREIFKPGVLENAPKEKLRDMCVQYGIDSVGIRSSLVDRLREYYNKNILPRQMEEQAKAQQTLSQVKATASVREVAPAADTIAPAPSMPTADRPQSTLTNNDPSQQAHDPTATLAAQPQSQDEPGTPPAEQAEAKAPEPMKVDIKTVADSLAIGYSYLIQEERLDSSLKIFSYLLTEKEFTGLCFTRSNPKKVREKFNLEKVSMMWLTDQESDKETVVTPSLEGIIYIIEEFLGRGKKTVLIIDGLEYLIGNNGFNPVLRFLRRLIDKISETETILIINVSPETMDDRELKLLERELEPLPK